MKKYKLEIEFTEEDLELLSDVFSYAVDLCDEHKGEYIIKEHNGIFEQLDLEQKSKDIEEFAKYINEHLKKVED